MSVPQLMQGRGMVLAGLDGLDEVDDEVGEDEEDGEVEQDADGFFHRGYQSRGGWSSRHAPAMAERVKMRVASRMRRGVRWVIG